MKVSVTNYTTRIRPLQYTRRTLRGGGGGVVLGAVLGRSPRHGEEDHRGHRTREPGVIKEPRELGGGDGGGGSGDGRRISGAAAGTAGDAAAEGAPGDGGAAGAAGAAAGTAGPSCPTTATTKAPVERSAAETRGGGVHRVRQDGRMFLRDGVSV